MRFNVIDSFPDFNKPGFNMETYNRQFHDSNIVIHAKARKIYYPEHWGGLSIKCAVNGKEYYGVNNCELAVDEKKYLILNNGNYYRSYIDSDSEVESFTVNFTEEFINDAFASYARNYDFNLDNTGYNNDSVEFYERLYHHDELISPLIYKLKSMSRNFKENLACIEETYFLLAEKLIQKQKTLQKNICEVPVLKLSTKKELYKRLVRAKDYMDSCYNTDISIAALAGICFLNESYFLRQFRNYFKVTPRQYLIKKRMEVAKELLESRKDLCVSEICLMVGYNDLSSFSKLFKCFYQYSPEKYLRSLGCPASILSSIN